MKIDNCFAPIVDENVEILILGTSPGKESLLTGEYYKSARNNFWKLIYKVYDSKDLDDDYNNKIRFLLKNKIGIWDVLSNFIREGSLDVNIKESEVNDFEQLFDKFPDIKCIVFNGKNAEKYFKNKVPNFYNTINHITVLSSSNSCAKTFEEKLDNWKVSIKNCI